jgi:hypothetical protein
MSARAETGSATPAEVEVEAAEDCGGYLVPVDPMEELQCDSCQ